MNPSLCKSYNAAYTIKVGLSWNSQSYINLISMQRCAKLDPILGVCHSQITDVHWPTFLQLGQTWKAICCNQRRNNATARMQILQHQVSLHGLENWQSVPRPVLVNRVCRTPQGVPEFFRSVLSWWTAEGCSRCVLFKNNHIVSLTYNVLSSRAVVRNLFCLIYPLT